MASTVGSRAARVRATSARTSSPRRTLAGVAPQSRRNSAHVSSSTETRATRAPHEGDACPPALRPMSARACASDVAGAPCCRRFSRFRRALLTPVACLFTPSGARACPFGCEDRSAGSAGLVPVGGCWGGLDLDRMSYCRLASRWGLMCLVLCPSDLGRLRGSATCSWKCYVFVVLLGVDSLASSRLDHGRRSADRYARHAGSACARGGRHGKKPCGRRCASS